MLNTLASHGYEARLVGGCVRDTLLGRAPHDYDVATSALPEEVERCFNRTVPTGIRHGTVTVIIRSRAVEVTTYRREGAYSDHRRPDSVSYTPSLAEDLSRRDFTINAMAMDAHGDVTDLFGGREDLSLGLIRCVGEPGRRFEEDALCAAGFELERTDAQGLYELCEEVDESELQPGDLVFFTETYETDLTVTHVGIYVGDNMMLHAGDPVQYTSLEGDYWQTHLYAYGRIS